MKIVNNKISIVKGETPTYSANVIDKDTGAPFMIASGINNPTIEFIVRPSIYNREEDYAFRIYLDVSSVHRFDDIEIVQYDGDVWDNDDPPKPGKEDNLYRRTVAGVSDYAYYSNSKWVPYSFMITFEFPYSATSVMEAKVYKYEITLFGGNKKSSPVVGENPVVVDYKYPILEATDFTVGGSLSE